MVCSIGAPFLYRGLYLSNPQRFPAGTWTRRGGAGCQLLAASGNDLFAGGGGRGKSGAQETRRIVGRFSAQPFKIPRASGGGSKCKKVALADLQHPATRGPPVPPFSAGRCGGHWLSETDPSEPVELQR